AHRQSSVDQGEDGEVTLRVIRDGTKDQTSDAQLRMRSPPPSVQPQPLFRIFADPAFDDIGDRLHGSLNVDLSGGVANRLDFLRELAAETIVGQADNTRAVDRAFDLPSQTGEHRISPGLATEEGDLDAIGQILI